MEFAGDRRPSNFETALEDQRFESSFRQVEGGDEAVVASADDDDFAGRVGHSVREFGENASQQLRRFQPTRCPSTARDLRFAQFTLGSG
jgi:hypothetical protein